MCFSESLHTKHTDSLSSTQKSLSFSPCTSQTSSTFKKDSHRFFNTRFPGGSGLEDLLLQTGHSWVLLLLQKCWRQSLQMLWLHDRNTGDLKISQHTGQDSSSTESDSISVWWTPRALYFLIVVEAAWQEQRNTDTSWYVKYECVYDDPVCINWMHCKDHAKKIVCKHTP